MTNFTIAPDDMHITVLKHCLSTYQFGTHVAKHHFCKLCGIFTFVETRLNPGEYRINLGCVKTIEVNKLKIERYNGKSL